MMEMNIPILTAKDVELRVGRIAKEGNYCILLAYKDARVDRRILDQLFGCFGWKREHQLIDGQLFCTVSVWDDKKNQWISKQDVGVESNMQAEKGRASDSFKRACFQWGIGVELYDAPILKINLDKGESDNGRLKVAFKVKELEYDRENGEYTKFVVIDNHHTVRFSLNKTKEKTKEETKEKLKTEGTDTKPQTTSLTDIGEITRKLGGTLTEHDNGYVRMRNGICEVYIQKLNIWKPLNAMGKNQLESVLKNDVYEDVWEEASNLLDALNQK